MSDINEYWCKTGHFDKNQFALFSKILADLNPEMTLEIGFATGRSLVATILSCAPDEAHSVDIDLDYMPPGRAMAKKITSSFPRVYIHEMDSRLFFQKNTKRFDFIFVDGSHEYRDCLRDLYNSWSVLKKGGMMIVDDYKGEREDGSPRIKEVIEAVNKFSKEKQLKFQSWKMQKKGMAIFRKR